MVFQTTLVVHAQLVIWVVTSTHVKTIVLVVLVRGSKRADIITVNANNKKIGIHLNSYFLLTSINTGKIIGILPVFSDKKGIRVLIISDFKSLKLTLLDFSF